MHDWTPELDALATEVLGYAEERLKRPKDPRWGAKSAAELSAALDGSISDGGIGGHAALDLFRDTLLPACRPNDDPMMLSYVPTAPSIAAVLFDTVVGASSIFAGHWEAGAGAIAAENQALRWLMDLAEYPDTGAGCFVSGGTAANLAGLVSARHRWRARHDRAGDTRPLAVLATDGAHASIDVVARVMDVDLVRVASDSDGRMTGASLRATLDEAGAVQPFAVVASAGTTNAGAVDELDAIADVCAEKGLWLHVDAAYGGAVLASRTHRQVLHGIERSDSFGIDPHKWLYAPYDCAAVLYRDPTAAAGAHAQSAAYLDGVDRRESNPSDLALHLTRRARGLPLWFSLATNGTDAYRDAVDAALRLTDTLARRIEETSELELVIAPTLSVVLFRRLGWTETDYRTWSERTAAAGTALVVPTRWRGEMCLRICIVNPRTDPADLERLIDDLVRA